MYSLSIKMFWFPHMETQRILNGLNNLEKEEQSWRPLSLPYFKAYKELQ